ncbi:oxidoreductase [Pullulanibacillus camelliae]|uniref:Oxidoreductase n=1 Tax=Pullulanibacillus camelliae TaxID=1707096 RepID=A0A8J3DZV0_9BACL|nr:Gfo/Idh/MocA family oxidoreductase [Pullulanibacillus camelliae]GGE49126.1 oxidoreductase [Pullulanibacillus camelliae]
MVFETPVTILLVGIGGYGNTYLDLLFKEGAAHQAILVGVVDIHPERSDYYSRIVDQGIPIYSTIEDFFEQAYADLTIISTPIHLHAQHSCFAMRQGSHVLCEKPMCASLSEAKEMIGARNETNTFLAIGFNWSFTPAVQRLKADVINGVFGKPLRLKTIALWPRTRDYYTRSSWAGKTYSSNGQPIFDSVANNATAHFLHHMFYILGKEMHTSIALKTVTAELYRANPIETFDTCATRIITENDIEILFYASHAVETYQGPHFVFEFENATLTYSMDEEERQVIAHFNDGSKKYYADPEQERPRKLWTCIEAVRTHSNQVLCGPEAAASHMLAIHAMHQSVPEAIAFPEQIKRFDSDTKLTWVTGLSEGLMECYSQGILPSESGLVWSRRGKTIAVDHSWLPFNQKI